MVAGRGRSGLALIVVIGVLGVLAVLATAFVTLSQLERKAARQRLHASQAFLLARSGLEDALARLEKGQDPAYGGEDWDGSGILDGLEPAAEAFRPGTLDTEACPVRHALRPSFFVRDPSSLGADGKAAPRRQGVDGRERGYSGSPGGGSPLQQICLKVRPREGLHVNGGNLSGADSDFNGIPDCRDPNQGYNAALLRILGNLAEEIGAPLVRADGERLVTLRPAGGWTSFDQVQALAWADSAQKRSALEPRLLLEAWVDRKVIQPSARPALVGTYPKSWTEILLGRADDGSFSGGRSTSPPRFEPRSPVPLPWARRHREVLVSLIRDLSGVFLRERYMQPRVWNRVDSVGRLQQATIGPDEARRVAALLATTSSDLSTWAGFQAYCDTLPSDVATGFTGGSAAEVQAKRDLLKANFNPESDLNKFNPNPSLWKSVDKSDLLAHSTEFSLIPLNGWEVSAVGRILDRGGRTLAARELMATVAGPSLLRLTAQSEFTCEDLGRLDIAGDELGVRLPGYVRAGRCPFITASNGTSRTWGHRLSTTGIYIGTWLDADSPGLSLQTYPEPCVDAGGGLFFPTAAHDGNLQLATLETPDDAWYTVTAATMDMKCLARFDDRFDLDLADAGKPDGAWCLPDTGQVATTELANSLLQMSKPNTLHPDGAYSERNRCPGYLDRGNAHGTHGLISFWVKPAYDRTAMGELGMTGGGNQSDRGHQFLKWTHFGAPDPHFFFLGNATFNDSREQMRFLAQFEIAHTASDLDHEHRFCTPFRDVLPHRWYLLSLYYDFEAHPGENDCGRLVVDAGGSAANLGLTDPYDIAGETGQNAWTSATDITQDAPDVPGGPVLAHRMYLGCRGETNHLTTDSRLGTGADATLDEFAIYDFGQSPGCAETFAAARYAEGRYYKGWVYDRLDAAPANDQAASWFSPPIPLPAGAVVRQVLWTWHRPRDLPGDYAEIALVRDAPGGPQYLWEEQASRSTRAAGWSADAQAWEVARAPQGTPFRAHVVFRRPAALPASTPILDSPVLDDLTFVYALGPRILEFTP